jgi:hypothetical protein
MWSDICWEFYPVNESRKSDGCLSVAVDSTRKSLDDLVESVKLKKLY